MTGYNHEHKFAKRLLMKYNPTLETDRLYLRKLSINDKNAIFDYASDPQIDKYVGWDYHKSLDDSLEFLDSIVKKYENNEPSDWGIIEKDSDKLVGTIGIFNLNGVHKYIEVGYALSRQYWNKGIMTEALGKVIRFCFEDIGVNRIEANCFTGNKASARVLEKCGFVHEGLLREKFYTKGRFNDVHLFSLLKKEWKKLSVR